jgi:hypothetical protein
MCDVVVQNPDMMIINLETFETFRIPLHVANPPILADTVTQSDNLNGYVLASVAELYQTIGNSAEVLRQASE